MLSAYASPATGATLGTPVTQSSLHSTAPTEPVLAVPSPALLSHPREFTTQELQLSGACDWYKISRLVDSETKLMKMLAKAGLHTEAVKLEEMRDDVLAHRMANSPYQSAKMFFRNNCANDAYIAKWRHDIDAFVRALRKTVDKEKVPTDRAIDIVYQSQLLRQQARVSLPYTGFYNPVPKVPSIPQKTFREPRHEPRFTTTPLSSLGLKPVEITKHDPNIVTASLDPRAALFLQTTDHLADFL